MSPWANVLVETQVLNYCSLIMMQHVSLQPCLLYQGVPPSSWSAQGRRSVSVQPRMGRRILETRQRSTSRIPSMRLPLESNGKATENCSKEFEFMNSNENLKWTSLTNISLRKEDERKITNEMIQREMYGSKESGIFSESSNQEYSSPDCFRSRFDRHQESRGSKRNIRKKTLRSQSQPVSLSTEADMLNICVRF